MGRPAVSRPSNPFTTEVHDIEDQRLPGMRATVDRMPEQELGPGRRGHPGRGLVVSTCLLVPMALAPLGSSPQEVSGPLVEAGRIRIEASAIHLYADRRFGERMEGGSLLEEEEPLGFDFSDRAVGGRLFPGLEELERVLETATGGPVEPLVLGSSEAVVTRDAVWLPIRLDVGVFDWLSVGGMIPFSRRRAEVAWAFGGHGANAGTSPSKSDAIAVSNFVGDVLNAEATLSERVGELCSQDPTGSGCSEASSLLATSQRFREAVLAGLVGYGVFPLAGTPTGDALQSRIRSLMAAHEALGIGYPSAVPLATEPLTQEEYGALVTDPEHGVVGAPIESWRSRWKMGDAEIYANFRLLASEPASAGEPPPSGPSYQIGAGALVRLGTGQTDLPDHFLDAGSGDGQQDFEVSVFGGLGSGRLGVWGEVQYGLATSTLVTRRVTAPDRIFAPLATTRVVRWTPGNYYRIRLTPRFRLTEEMAVVADLQAFSKASDTYELADPGQPLPSGLDVDLLELETAQSVLEAGFGFVYSTLRSGRGRPMEARFLYRRSVSGAGGLTPKSERLEFGLRLFRGLWN